MARRRFRNSVKAVIIRDGCVLCTVNRDAQGEFLLLPGGGQRFGETLAEALQRECAEEIGCPIVVGDLLGIREYIGAHHEFAATDSDFHQVEIMFQCALAEGCEPRFGRRPDEERLWTQIGVAWIPLSELPRYRIYPSVLKDWLRTLPQPAKRYLGDVN